MLTRSCCEEVIRQTPGPAVIRRFAVTSLLHLLLLLQGMEGLSARERNRLKRKAKAMGRQDSVTRSLDSGNFPVRSEQRSLDLPVWEDKGGKVACCAAGLGARLEDC